MQPARTVSAHMTAAPYTIQAQATLVEAQSRMRELGLQQLPVIDDGKPCGVLLERDLSLARQLGVDLGTITVRALLPHDAFSVQPDESLASAVRSMASRAAACAAVVEASEVRGVLTINDALRALADLLEHEADGLRSAISPHSDLDESLLLDHAEQTARRILETPTVSQRDAEELRSAVHELYQAQRARLADDERELACTPADRLPLHKTRVEQLRDEHQKHAQILADILKTIDDPGESTEVIAAEVEQAVNALRAYLTRQRDALRFVS